MGDVDTNSARALEAARALIPVIRERANEAESLRRLPEASVQDLIRVGVARMLTPKAFGGYEADLERLADLIVEFARVCGGTGWLTALYGTNSWVAALLPQKAQAEIWKDGPDTLIGAQLAILGTVKRAPGGFILNGRWAQSSGVDNAKWFIVGAVETRDDGTRVGWECAAEASAIQIDDTWHGIGVRGSGSKSLIAKDVFVPEHRVVCYTDLVRGTAPAAQAPGVSSLYRVPMVYALTTSITYVTLGVTLGALDAAIGQLKKRKETNAAVLANLADFAASAESAHLLLKQSLQEGQATARRGERHAAMDRVRTRRNAAYVARLCNRAFTELIGDLGGGVLYEPHPIQRAWRDVRMIAAHVALNFHAAGELWGQLALELVSPDDVGW